MGVLGLVTIGLVVMAFLLCLVGLAHMSDDSEWWVSVLRLAIGVGVLAAGMALATAIVAAVKGVSW